MHLSAIGFNPVNFSVTITGEPTMYAGPDGKTALKRTYRVPASGPDGVVGDFDYVLHFEPVPPDLNYYTANVDVSSVADDGNVYTNHYVFGVHNPIEYITTGPPQQAEVYAPESVSQCYSGGNATGATYSWTQSMTTDETQMRGTSENWDKSFTMGHSMLQSVATTNTVNLSVADSATTGWSSAWNSTTSQTAEQGSSQGWNAGVEVDAHVNAGPPFFSGSVGGSVSAGVNGQTQSSTSVTGSYGTNFDLNHSDSRTATVGHDYSTSDTEQYSYEQSQTASHSVGQQFSWTTSWSTTTSMTQEVMVLPGRVAMMYRQRIRIEYPAVIVAYDLCGNATAVANAAFTDWQWTTGTVQGTSCPPPPDPPAFQKPQCLLDCGGN
jgi:hypothetical protein